MGDDKRKTVREVLLTRRGLVFLASSGEPLPDEPLRALELELANVGYVVSSRLRERLGRCTLDEVKAFRAWALATILAHTGADQKHKPLFRRFPDGVPSNTSELWWRRALVHFLQSEEQPCLFCRRRGTTHVLDPCCHVVCDQCFDGSNYSGCPVCGERVNEASPFFKPTRERELPKETVVFKLLDLGEDEGAEAKAMFLALCSRPQALSPDDRDVLLTILDEYHGRVLSWLPKTIVVRENIATVFGTLFDACEPAEVLPHAKRFMTTATDVLRFIAVYAGTDGSLQRETVFKQFDELVPPSRFWGRVAELLGARPPGPRQRTVAIPLRVHRFKVKKLSRPLRRALLSVLEGMNAERLTEDMLRHRSYWVWVGQFLHPHEYAARYPKAAAAFQVARKKQPDGTPAPRFQSWYSRVEACVADADVDALVSLLRERPGEFARRLDHALRLASNAGTRKRVSSAFLEHVGSLATPVLLTLSAHLPERDELAEVRVYWPKGTTAKGVSSPDQRPTLPKETTEPLVRRINDELLARFEKKGAAPTCLVDESLANITVPFNERTAARAGVALPRGSRVAVPEGKLARLFLHWCEPKLKGRRTDLDLSVGFYDEAWEYVGVCSYYQLESRSGGQLIARSAGDLTSAPWPDGATEYVDLHREAASAASVRYAVMVVNAYSGLPFSLLERAFAGLMLRDDAFGKQFDPRTVELKFSLAGESGIYLPLIFDIQKNVLHWLDVHQKGQFEMNNVETSNSAISKVCPDLVTYFESGVRPSMLDLALLHAAARSERVFLRGQTISEFVRRAGETTSEFHQRLVRREADEPRSRGPRADGPPTLAFLYRGDLDLPDGSSIYALFRERVPPSLAASDLLS